jgi:hypothetical protein
MARLDRLAWLVVTAAEAGPAFKGSHGPTAGAPSALTRNNAGMIMGEGENELALSAQLKRS